MSRPISIAILAIVLVGACGSPAPSPSPSTAASPTPLATPQPPPSAGTPTPANPAPPSATASATPGATVTTGDIHWSPASSHDTAVVVVPLDYANPGAGTIKLVVVRRRATDQAHRIGVLFLNPGGPGGSGVDFIDAADREVPAVIAQRFDLVSWDPRGVGLSSGITCPDKTVVAQAEALDPTPTRPEEVAAYRNVFDTVAAQCQAASGDLLPHLAEANTARDMDAIRAAMGEATISYWGFSYGTYLGYLYATMFPSRLRAAILDGPVDPTLDLAGRDQGQARGFQAAFDHQLGLCGASKACPFWNGGHPEAAFSALLAGLDKQPLATPGGTVGPGEAVSGVILMLYGSDPRSLVQALADAQHGNGQQLLAAANFYYEQVQLGAYLATACIDVARPSSPAEIDKVLAATRSEAPLFGPLVVLGDAYGCLDWPIAPQPVPAGAPPEGLPPVLVIASTWDPATPPWGAAPLAKALGTGVVLMRDGLGHTTGGSASSNPCLRDATAAYLTALTEPAAGTVCKDPPPPFGP